MQFDNSALVLFSGGQDSTTCLAWALERFENVETVGFPFDLITAREHLVELECRDPILSEIKNQNSDWDKALGDDHVGLIHDYGGC